MKIKLQTTEYIPEYTICFLEYGNPDNPTDEDIENILEYLDKLSKLGYTNPVFSYDFEDKNFLRFPPFGLATDCVKTTITQFK